MRQMVRAYFVYIVLLTLTLSRVDEPAPAGAKCVETNRSSLGPNITQSRPICNSRILHVLYMLNLYTI